MCCVFTILLFIGPRAAIFFWWLLNPARFAQAFASLGTWIVPLLSALVIPWTTLGYLVVFPGGVQGFDWVWIGVGVIADIASYAGGGARSHSR